jgi:hypothetical protein
MTGIGTVERFVAEREVGDDIVHDRNFQQRPLKPGRVAQVATPDPAVFVDVHPYQDIAAKTFSEGKALTTVTGNEGIDFAANF